MKKRNSKRKGLLLAPDDLMVGKFIAVHSLKGSSRPLPYFGHASEVRAINLPFVVVRSVGGHTPATVDVRYLNLMAVTDDFVRAQAPPEQGIGQEKPPVNAEQQGA
jgi:hypothetical protein